MKEASYKTILRSSSIMGGASLLNILFGLIKIKFVAVLLGPAGVGLIGLYQSLVQTGSQFASLGSATVGTQQIAAAANDGDAAVDRVRRALFWGTIALSVIGALIFLVFSGTIASYVLKVPERRSDVAWLSLGVALTVAAGAQTALLTGLRRVKDLALLQVGAGFSACVFGMAAVGLWGSAGILVFVLAMPIVTFAIGLFFASRVGRPRGARPSFIEITRKWSQFARLGVAFMLSGVVTILGRLAVQTLVQRDLGPEALGQFQASWSIGMTYLGFVLGAMTTDYFPRLSGAIGDHPKATRLVNEQTEVALILSGPVLVAMLALAPIVVRLLYTPEFSPTVDILRWQLLGDILKIISWPIGFVLLASGSGRLFIFSEAIGVGVFVTFTALLMPVVGVSGAGIGFLFLYIFYLPTVWIFARLLIGFRWSSAVKRLTVIVIVAAGVTDIFVRFSDFWGGLVGVTLASFLAVSGFIQMSRKTEYGGAIGRRIQRLRFSFKSVGR